MPPSLTPPLRILAAGSLRAALTAFAGIHGSSPDLVFGPAGLLRERIEGGELCDLYLSANLEHPKALAAGKTGATVTSFARNPIVVVARRDVGLQTANLLDVLLDPAIRIGTSTPGADPGGDYAVALFRRAGAMREGADQVLEAKARHLVGGRDTPAMADGHPLGRFLAAERVDLVLCYRTGAQALADDYDVVVPSPSLEVIGEYGLVVLAEEPARHAAASAFANELLGPRGRNCLEAHGFEIGG
jgi:molybdate transport system substrate-binding protein